MTAAVAAKMKLSELFHALDTSFGVEVDADGSDYLHLGCMGDMSFQPMVDVITREAQVNDLTRQPHVMGPKKGTLTFKLYLKASGLAAAVTAAAASESDKILQSLLGTVVRGTTDVVQAGTTATVVNVVSGAHFSKGMAVRVTKADGTYVTRIVASISSNALTLDRSAGTIPVTGSVIYASSRYTRANTGHTSLSFVGYRDGIEYTFRGCNVSAKLTGVTARGSAILDVTANAADWSVTTKYGSSLPSAVLTGITAVRAPSIKGAPIAIGGVEEAVYSFDFDFGCKFEFKETTAGGGYEGGDGVVAGMELVDSTPGGAFKVYFAASHLTDFLAGTQRSLVVSSGDHLTGWALYIPNAQYTDTKLEDTRGMVGENIPFMVNDNGADPEFYLSIF